MRGGQFRVFGLLEVFIVKPGETKRLILSCCGAIAFLFIFSFVPISHGQSDTMVENDLCALPEMRTDQRPDPEGPPTEVSIGIRMFDLSEINDVKQTLTGDFIVGLTWTDPRLSDFAGCQVPLSRVWSPQLDFFNSGRLFKRLSDHVDIGPNGRVRYIQRYSGSLASYHNLKAFPFDAQKFRIWLSSLEYDEKEVQLVVDEKITGRRKLLNISDWTINGVKGTIDRTFAEGLGQYHSMYEFQISAQRQTGFYLWKVILPLCLIVFMSWAVFWISPAQFGPQIGLSATSMLTLIAFQFATANILPKISYFTILDKFITGSTILVFLALLESLSTTFLVASEHTKLALRVDNVCRIAFPLTFLIMVAFIFFR
jgi:hypothetical protein